MASACHLMYLESSANRPPRSIFHGFPGLSAAVLLTFREGSSAVPLIGKGVCLGVTFQDEDALAVIFQLVD